MTICINKMLLCSAVKIDKNYIVQHRSKLDKMKASFPRHYLISLWTSPLLLKSNTIVYMLCLVYTTYAVVNWFDLHWIIPSLVDLNISNLHLSWTSDCSYFSITIFS